ncbi:MAG TPA: 3-beta hydroxysteroid dehydrogenase [Propionibacteriaceae bacterium]|nr:3-beta hydroxysteroid dehydrogenase [Propionibacteriaceae bacterium]
MNSDSFPSTQRSRVAVAGGTGVVGRQVVHALTRAGHEPVVLARSVGVDLVTGAGLDAALSGVDAVVDVSNIATQRRRRAVDFFTTATHNLLAVGGRAGVRHHVALSIVGVDRVNLGYYAAKLAQESLVLASSTGTVLRATQFHEFADLMLARSKGPVVPVPRMRIQPIAAAEVAVALAELAVGPAQARAADLGGPEEYWLAELLRRRLQARPQRRWVVEVRLPGRLGSALANGALLPVGNGPRGRQTFSEWLAAAGN